MSVVVSLSTIPTRFPYLQPVLEHLLAQTADIDEIRLYIPKTYRRFQDYDGSLPDVPKGIRIIQPDDDLGPASKVLFAAEDLRGTDCDIIYCDDDRIYHKKWFAQMLAARAGRKNTCVSTSILELHQLGFEVESTRRPRMKQTSSNLHRSVGLIKRKIKQVCTGITDRKPPRNRDVKKPGYADIAEGFGAVLVRPDFFDAEAYDIPAVLWSVDDVWLSGHMERKGVPIWCAKGLSRPPINDGGDKSPLFRAVIDGFGRDAANKACVQYMQDTYGIWK